MADSIVVGRTVGNVSVEVRVSDSGDVSTGSIVAMRAITAIAQLLATMGAATAADPEASPAGPVEKWEKTDAGTYRRVEPDAPKAEPPAEPKKRERKPKAEPELAEEVRKPEPAAKATTKPAEPEPPMFSEEDDDVDNMDEEDVAPAATGVLPLPAREAPFTSMRACADFIVEARKDISAADMTATLNAWAKEVPVLVAYVKAGELDRRIMGVVVKYGLK